MTPCGLSECQSSRSLAEKSDGIKTGRLECEGTITGLVGSPRSYAAQNKCNADANGIVDDSYDKSADLPM